MERLTWWMDMSSCLILLATALYVAVVFADVLSPVAVVMISLMAIVGFLYQFEALAGRLARIRKPEPASVPSQISA
ncbi:MAG TPA: hypothetical protein VMS71_00205 [Candidatus Acidoferrum sp.]|nr:hypothetical protein [Candidatus Acidoferrum sp.]